MIVKRRTNNVFTIENMFMLQNYLRMEAIRS